MEKQKRSRKFAKLLCAFANTKGGTIIFGVTDNVKIEGLDSGELDQIENFLQEIIQRKITPKIVITREEVVIDGKAIGLIHVENYPNVKVMNLNDDKYYIRRGSSVRPMFPEEIFQ